jgi:hypothetical protein
MTRLLKRRSYLLLAAAIACHLPLGRAHAIAIGELDAFTVDLENWSQGQAPTPTAGLTRAESGGPAGAGDPFMQIVANAFISHGKIIAFNLSPAWTGDYITAGVTDISMSVNNPGPNDLQLRVAFGTAPTPSHGGAWLSSTNPVNLPAGSGWMSVQFPLDPASLTSVTGPTTYETVMSGVVALRLLHSPTPDSRGVEIVGALGVDNILSLGAGSLPADFDRNGVVNGDDLAQWRDDFGVNDMSDADDDGDSDGADFLEWQRQLDSGNPAVATAVPEPPALALIAIVSCASALGSKGKRCVNSGCRAFNSRRVWIVGNQ